MKEQTKLKASRRKEIIKIRVEINKIQNRKTTGKNQCNQKLVLWKDQQNQQSLARLRKERGHKWSKSDLKLGTVTSILQKQKELQENTMNEQAG